MNIREYVVEQFLQIIEMGQIQLNMAKRAANFSADALKAYRSKIPEVAKSLPGHVKEIATMDPAEKAKLLGKFKKVSTLPTA